MRRMVVGIALFVSTAVVCGASSSRADNMMAAQPPASFQTEKATKCEDPNPTVGKVNRIVMSSDIVTTSDGWCTRINTYDSHAWQRATLISAPEHGEVFVTNSGNPSMIGSKSIIGYRAVRGYTGTDVFEIQWQPRGVRWIYNVTVGP